MGDFLLAIGSLGVTIRPEFFFRERLRMVAMGVQGQHHGCAFLHDAYSRVTAAVDAPLVSLRQTKPAFQLQVVARPIAPIAAGEQARLETHHHAAHLLANRIGGGHYPARQRCELPETY